MDVSDEPYRTCHRDRPDPGPALVFGNFGDMLIVALLGLIGYGIAKVLDGELDLQGWLARSRFRR